MSGGKLPPYRGGSESRPYGDASYYPSVPRDTFMLTRFNIEPGQVVKISSQDDGLKDQWWPGPMFLTKHCIFVGSPDLWVLSKESEVFGTMLTPADLPMDSFRPPAPSFVNWPVFNVWGQYLQLMVENRGKELGHFVARLAGEYETESTSHGPTGFQFDPSRGL